MSLNKVILEGKIISDPKFSGNEGSEFITFILGVNKNYKGKDEQYPASLGIPCKAFKHNAVFINKYFTKMSSIIIVGSMDQDAEYTRPDGSVKPAEFYIKIDEQYFSGDKGSNPAAGGDNAGGSNAQATAAPSRAGASPFAAIQQTAAPKTASPFSSPIKRTGGIGGR